ncbi:MAG: VOC family protein [Candidatus Acidiferrales bacterium]
MAIDIRGMAPLLQVFDMRTSIEFYRDVLGFEVVANSPPRPEVLFDWALLRRDGIELMLNGAYEEGQRPAVPEPARVAAHDDRALYLGVPTWTRRTLICVRRAWRKRSRKSRPTV